MATIVNRRRGTTAQHAAFTGAVGETTYNTDVKILVAHDGILAGGFPAAHLHVGNIFSQPQTIAVASGVPTIAFDILVDGLSRFQARKTGYVAVLRQEADTSPASFELTKRGTTGNALAALSNGSGIGSMYFRGHDGTAFGDAGSVQTTATQAWAVGAHGSQLVFRTVPIGSATETTHATLNSTELSVTSRLLLPNTTSATVGGIYFGGNRAFHNFGTNNIFAGVNAGNFTLTGVSNSFFGAGNGMALTTGSYNSFFGAGAGAGTTTGTNNSFFGRNAGLNNTTGLSNSCFGAYAGQANTTGSVNSFFGRSAGSANTTGAYNSFFGRNAGLSNTTGVNNSFFGVSAGRSNTTGINNSFFGVNAGYANTGTSNSFFGVNAGYANTGTSNSFFGVNAGRSNTTGASNSCFGAYAGLSNTTGANNSFFGRGVGQANTTGANNTLFGFQAGNNLTTGSNNLVLGYDIDSPTATNSNTLTIGNLIFGTAVDGAGTTISSGFVGIKVIDPVTELHVVTTSAADPRGIMSAQHSTDAIGARIHFRKSRGTAIAPTTVVTGDVLGRARFSGYDGANYLQMGSIDVVSVGTIAATRVPTYMAFSTATDVTPSVLTERLRIDQAGKIQILTGVGNDAGGFKHARVTTGSVGAGATALVTITWTTAFADTNYTVNASVLDATTSSLSLSVVHIETITAAAVTVRVLNNAIGSLTGTVHVIAVHD